MCVCVCVCVCVYALIVMYRQYPIREINSYVI